MAATLAAAFVVIPGQAASADEFFTPYGSWNGKKIYLSPARHSDAGTRGECGGRNENDMAFVVARTATQGQYMGDYDSNYYAPTNAGRSLRASNYQVRIGTGTINTAISNSNAWGSTLHIPIHSNARTESCSNTTLSSHGTVGIYYTTNGARLAALLKESHEGSSPGSNDYSCSDSSGCSQTTLGELRQTNAVAGYLESEFHSWNSGSNWVDLGVTWGWRIRWATDRYLGYPR